MEEEELTRGQEGKVSSKREPSARPWALSPRREARGGQERPFRPFKAERRGASRRGRCQGPSRPLIGRCSRSERLRGRRLAGKGRAPPPGDTGCWFPRTRGGRRGAGGAGGRAVETRRARRGCSAELRRRFSRHGGRGECARGSRAGAGAGGSPGAGLGPRARRWEEVSLGEEHLGRFPLSPPPPPWPSITSAVTSTVPPPASCLAHPLDRSGEFLCPGPGTVSPKPWPRSTGVTIIAGLVTHAGERSVPPGRWPRPCLLKTALSAPCRLLGEAILDQPVLNSTPPHTHTHHGSSSPYYIFLQIT